MTQFWLATEMWCNKLQPDVQRGFESVFNRRKRRWGRKRAGGVEPPWPVITTHPECRARLSTAQFLLSAFFFSLLLHNLSCESLPGCTKSLLALCKKHVDCVWTFFSVSTSHGHALYSGGLALRHSPVGVFLGDASPHCWPPRSLVSTPHQFAPLKKQLIYSFVKLLIKKKTPVGQNWILPPKTKEKSSWIPRNGLFSPVFTASHSFCLLSSSVGPALFVRRPIKAGGGGGAAPTADLRQDEMDALCDITKSHLTELKSFSTLMRPLWHHKELIHRTENLTHACALCDIS